MSGQTPNSLNIARVGAGVANSTGIVAHPEYVYWRYEWSKLRDVIAGQREVKRMGAYYLPAMKGMDKDDFAGYLLRATFYNMTAQTLNGMIGQVFRRDPLCRELPARFKPLLRTQFAKDGTGHVNFCKTVMSEQVAMGRFGVLVDAPATPSVDPTSFVVGYAAENIIDWTVELVDGFYKLTRVLLREFKREAVDTPVPSQNNPWLSDRGATLLGQKRPNYTDAYTYAASYRELLLTQQSDGTWLYSQNLYDVDPANEPTTANIIPVIRGVPLNFIPFMIFGATSNSADVEKSPLLDIADLNLSHYRSYAELEYGRLYTALPVYYAPGSDGEGAAEYHIGPNTVWEVTTGSEPGILEYKGEGLKALESALSTKEQQIAAIGGRLMPGTTRSVSESSSQTVLREANEQSILLNVILAAQDGMTQVVRWWLMFRDVPLSQSENLVYEVNQDFLSTPIGAREIRAIQLMYNDGLIPVETLYLYLRKAEIVHAETSLDEFIEMLNDPNSFLNSPDAQARQRGFANRQQEIAQAAQAREFDIQNRNLDLQERNTEIKEGQFEIAKSVDSTSVAATRKLGDPEQAAPSQAEGKQIAVQAKAADAAATAAKKAAAAKKIPAKKPVK